MILLRVFIVLIIVAAFMLTWLLLRRSPKFVGVCETLADNSAANAIAKFDKAECNLSTAEVLAKARSERQAVNAAKIRKRRIQKETT